MAENTKYASPGIDQGEQEFYDSLRNILDQCPPELIPSHVADYVRKYLAQAKCAQIQRQCTVCGQSFHPETNAQKAKKCSECRAKKKQAEIQERWSDYQREQERKRKGFENWTLTPAGMYWYLVGILTQEDCQTLAAMPYRGFLRTKYWGIVRNYVLYKQGKKCNLCASDQSLNVHHRTYEHRGYEVRHLQDLIVLCRDCHETFHDYREVN